jgi:hypothetical protein
MELGAECVKLWAPGEPRCDRRSPASSAFAIPGTFRGRERSPECQGGASPGSSRTWGARAFPNFAASVLAWAPPPSRPPGPVHPRRDTPPFPLSLLLSLPRQVLGNPCPLPLGGCGHAIAEGLSPLGLLSPWAWYLRLLKFPKTWSSCVTQVGSELGILLPQPPKPSHLAPKVHS